MLGRWVPGIWSYPFHTSTEQKLYQHGNEYYVYHVTLRYIDAKNNYDVYLPPLPHLSDIWNLQDSNASYINPFLTAAFFIAGKYNILSPSGNGCQAHFAWCQNNTCYPTIWILSQNTKEIYKFEWTVVFKDILVLGNNFHVPMNDGIFLELRRPTVESQQ